MGGDAAPDVSNAPAAPAPAPPQPAATPLPPGDDSVRRDFMATRALAQRPDPWAALNARYGQQPATAAAPAPEDTQPVAGRIVGAATAATPQAPEGFMARVSQAFEDGTKSALLPLLGPGATLVMGAAKAAGGPDLTGQPTHIAAAGQAGLAQSLKDLAATGDAVAGRAPAAGADAAYAQPLTWGDLANPSAALDKAVYQVAHGAPVLAAGTAGAVIGGASTDNPAGALAGGGLGAGAMSAAQSLGPFYAAALKANPADPAGAFNQAVKQAGAAGMFSAAGWALFGLKPFGGAVQNLLFQAFGVQPAVAAAGKVADNAIAGAPLAQGVAATVPGAVVGTLAPMVGHAIAGGGAAAAPEGEAAAAPPAPADASTPRVPDVAAVDPMQNPAHDAAARVIQLGKDTGNEHLRVYDPVTNSITHETEGGPSSVDATPEIMAAVTDPSNALVVQHNHPRSTALSGTDLQTLANPGLAYVVAHGHDGSFSAASAVDGEAPDPTEYARVFAAVRSAFNKGIRNGSLSPADADANETDTANRLLNFDGQINYLSSKQPSPTVLAISTDLAGRLFDADPATSDAYDRLSASVSPAEGLASVVSDARGIAGQKQAGGTGNPDAQAGNSGPSGRGTPSLEGTPEPAAPNPDAPHGIGAPPVPDARPDPTAIGDTKADPVTISPDIEKNAQDFLAGKPGSNPIKVNLAYIGTDNIQDTLEHISSMLPGQGVQSHETTTSLALTLGLQPQDFLAGYKGQQLDAAQTTAMRMMLDSSAQQLQSFAKAATDPTTATPAAMAQFVRAFATHQGIQQYFENARAEAGRTLNAYQIMSRSSSDMTKAISDLIAGAGGPDQIQQLAGRIADLDDPDKVNQLVAASRKMTGRDLFLYGYYNIILSSLPHVLAKKLTSDVMAATWEMGVRAIAARLPGAEVQPGEATQMAYGYAGAMMDAIRLAGRGIATGEHQFDGSSGTLDAIRGNLVKAAADGAPPDITPDQPTRAAVDYLKMALPVRWIGAADDFAKYVNYRAQLRGLAYRAAKQDPAGGDVDAAINQTLAAVPDDMHQQAVSAAMRTTFQDPLTGVAKALSDTADAINIPLPGTDFKIPFGRMVLPFVKIPANLLGWVYRNSPIAAAFPSQQIKADIAGGGAARDIAIARMALGSAVGLAALPFAINGRLTGRGPSDPGLNRAWRAAGNQPYSIMIGNTPYGFNQVDPLGMYLGAIADTADTLRFAPEQSRYDVAASLGFGLGNAMLSKTYMSGLSNFFDALQSPDKEGSKYVDRFISSLAAPGAAAAVQTATDPWLRAHYSLLDAVEARLPMVSQNLPPDRTLWGDPIRKQDGFLPGLSGTGLARAVSPVTYGAPQANAEPIDKWIWDNRAAFPHSDTGQLDLAKPGQVQSFGAGKGVNIQLQLSPAQLDRFQEQAGNGLKMPGTGLGAKDFLNALVRGNNPDASAQSTWNEADPAMRALLVQKVVSGMRTAAKHQLLGEFPDLAEAVRTGAQMRADQLNGANGVRPAGGTP